MLSSGRKQNSICQLSIILRGFIQCWYARGGGSSQRNEPLDPPLRTVLSEIRLVKRSPTLSAELLKPRLHDTTGCQTGCQTGLTTGLTTVLNEQMLNEQTVRSTRLSNRLYDPV